MINIPEELILNLIKFLDVEDICNFNSVNKNINNIYKRNENYITNLLVTNSKFSFHEFENNNCFRYVKIVILLYFLFVKKIIFLGQKEMFLL